MKRLFALAVAAALACSAARVVAAAAYVAPTMRHVNYVAVSAPKGADIKCHIDAIQHGYRPYQDRLECRLVRPDGQIAAKAVANVGASVDVAAKAEWEGRCALELNTGWNLARVRFDGDMPHAYLSRLNDPLRTVRAWGPLYFFVPKGTRYFNVFVQASVRGEGMRIEVANPAGEVVHVEDGDVDKRTKIQLKVPKGQDAAAWRLVLSKPQSGKFVLDDVYVELGRQLPPFLAPKPEWAKLFAGDWRYDPKAAKQRARLEKVEPKLEPFHGVRGTEIDQAYSRDTSKGWHTSLPFTYILDYGSRHLGNPDYVPTVASGPPTLLHLGKDVPFNHGWGPIKALGGENQAHGRGEDIKRITPEQVRERIAGLTHMVDALHKCGVRWVTPYICAMTIDGDAEKRTGFWEFYDHWNDYRSLGLCPKPSADPFEWLQRKPDGSLRMYYGYDYKRSYYPPFKTNHRYAACWNTEGWRTWLCEVVRFIARCGYDGVFVDNSCSQRCQCTRCLAKFREFLKKRYAPEQARRLFGCPLGEVTFPTGRGVSLLKAEMTRFWCQALRDEMATLKAVGSNALGREFIVFPNGGRPNYIQRGLSDADFVMFEKSIGNYGTHPGAVVCPVFDGVSLRAYNDNIFEHKFVQCLRSRVRPIILSRAGYPRRKPSFMLNANAARLGFAECGAFSGGGGFLLRPRWDLFADALNEYRKFFETHPRLFAGLDTFAQVAVLAFTEQSWYGNSAHTTAVRRLTDALSEAHVLFDYVPEDQFSQAALERYGVVVAAHLNYVSDAQLQALEGFVRSRGRLVLVGDFAKFDLTMTARPAPTRLDARTGQTQRLGRGIVVRCADLAGVSGALGDNVSRLSCPDHVAAPHVKINAFRSLDSKRLIVHLVNYNVQLGTKPVEPKPINGIVVDVPLPAGAKVLSATSYAPDESAAARVEVENAGGRARLRVPALRIYRVVEVALSVSPK